MKPSRAAWALNSRAYRVHLLAPAIRDLARLDKPIGRRVVKRLSLLAERFESVRPEPPTGELAGFYKLRVGDYRVVYEVIRTEHAILIHRVGHRRNIYRKLQ